MVDYTARPPRALGRCKLFWTYSYAQLHALLTRRALGLLSFNFQDSSCRLTGLGLSLPRVVVRFSCHLQFRSGSTSSVKCSPRKPDLLYHESALYLERQSRASIFRSSHVRSSMSSGKDAPQIRANPPPPVSAVILIFLHQNMVRVTPLLSAAFFSLAASEVVLAESQQHLKDSPAFQDRCALIASSISNASFLYYPCRLHVHPFSLGPTRFDSHLSVSTQYIADNSHWATSSNAQSACSVEPGTVQDVGVIVRLLSLPSSPSPVPLRPSLTLFPLTILSCVSPVKRARPSRSRVAATPPTLVSRPRRECRLP